MAVAFVGSLAGGAPALIPEAGADEIGDKRSEAKQIADQLTALQNRQIELGTQA